MVGGCEKQETSEDLERPADSISEQKYWAGGRACRAGDPILFEFSLAPVFAHKYVCSIAMTNHSSGQE